MIFDWKAIYNERIVNNVARNQLIVSIVEVAEKPCIVFIKSIPHGKILESMIGRAGMNVGFVWGQHKSIQRRGKIKALEGGRLDALIASVVFQTGIDIPDLRSAVIAIGEKAAIPCIQRVGRGMRVSDGKEGFNVYDIDDQSCGCHSVAKSLGISMAVHPPCRMLEEHTKKRVHAYISEGMR